MVTLSILINNRSKQLSILITIALSCFLFFSSCKNNDTLPKVIVKNFEILCAQNLLDSIYNHDKEHIYIPIKFISKGDTVSAKIRLRGDSSRQYDKKSLKIVFQKEHIPVGENKKINLNSEWTDKTYIRQYLSATLMQQAGLAAFNTNFVKLYLNGQFWGLYLQVENIDKAFLERNKLGVNGNLYKATKDGACLSHFDNIYNKWEKKTNKKENMDDLQLLINQIDTIDISNYKDYLQKTFEYNKLITIIAMNMLVQNGSTYYHNYYMYHSVSGKWQMMPWDLDKTMSFYNWKPYKYHETSSNWESDNPLIEKSFLNSEVYNDIKKEIARLGNTIFTKKNIYPIIKQCREVLEVAVSLDSTDQILNKSEWIRSIDREKRYFVNQVDNILNQFKILPSSFEIERVTKSQISNITLRWSVSKSQNPINYKLLYGTHFLLEEKDAIVIDNISDTLCYLENLEPGKYFFRVYAIDGKNKMEGFNTKSTFEIIPEKRRLISKDTILLRMNSPHLIDDTWVINENVTLTIEPGCVMRLSKHANIINRGRLLAKGTELDSIWFIPNEKYWGSIQSHGKDGQLEFNYCNIEDGFLNSKGSTVKLINCTYTIENKNLIVNGHRKSIIWIYEGVFIADNLLFENKYTSSGEGLNVNYANAYITNSTFIGMADAVEYIDVSEGEISNNIIINSPDDAIDLNGCSNIMIENNIIVNSHDKAISIGTEQYGPSINITVNNNVLIGNKFGLSIKDSSICNVTNTSFINNNTAIEAKLKNNSQQYSIGGSANVEACVFYNNNTVSKYDEASSVIIKESISNKSHLDGDNNITQKIVFDNEERLNYNTYLSVGVHLEDDLIIKLNKLTGGNTILK